MKRHDIYVPLFYCSNTPIWYNIGMKKSFIFLVICTILLLVARFTDRTFLYSLGLYGLIFCLVWVGIDAFRKNGGSETNNSVLSKSVGILSLAIGGFFIIAIILFSIVMMGASK